MDIKSIWKDYENIPSFEELGNDLEVDVLVIGGGISGILAARKLKEKGINVVLLEKNKIGSGVTSNTTAFVTAQHDILYSELIEKVGLEKAKTYFDLNIKAISEYRNLSKTYDFDFEMVDSIIHTSKDLELIEKEINAYKMLDADFEVIDALPETIENINGKILKGIKLKNQAIINPLKLIAELSKELEIYEYSCVYKVSGNTAFVKTSTSVNEVRFKRLVVATHYPLIDMFGMYYAKIHQRLSYVVAFHYPSIKDVYTSIDENGLYFRKYKNYLIVGGFDKDHSNTGDIKDLVEKIKQKVDVSKFPMKYIWSNQDIITLDNIPYIGRYDSFHLNRFVITGFNMWGFTQSMIASNVICDLISGNTSVDAQKAYELYYPLRSIFKKQLFLNLTNSVRSFIKLKTPRCTHMGSSLKYNNVEKTWECPCHGSRFNENGEVINGPANHSINV